MTRDEIKGLIPEIEDDVLNKIMDINGADINKAKGDTQNATKDYEDIKAQLTKAKATITELKNKVGDTEALNAELDKYKEQEEERAKAEEQAKIDNAMNTRFTAVVGDGKFLNDFTRNGIFDEFKKALADENNTGKADKDIYNGLIKDREGIFVMPNQQVGMTPPKNDIPPEDDDAVRKVMGLPPKK